MAERWVQHSNKSTASDQIYIGFRQAYLVFPRDKRGKASPFCAPRNLPSAAFRPPGVLQPANAASWRGRSRKRPGSDGGSLGCLGWSSACDDRRRRFDGQTHSLARHSLASVGRVARRSARAFVDGWLSCFETEKLARRSGCTSVNE